VGETSPYGFRDQRGGGRLSVYSGLSSGDNPPSMGGGHHGNHHVKNI